MLELNKLYNMDCMKGLKEIPDKFFDLAVVDPPYGGGCSQFSNVERERERTNCKADTQTLRPEAAHVLEGGLTSTISATRTGGTWSRRYQQERRRRRIFAIGILLRRKNILTN